MGSLCVASFFKEAGLGYASSVSLETKQRLKFMFLRKPPNLESIPKPRDSKFIAAL
jgi:hypothetical protein